MSRIIFTRKLFILSAVLLLACPAFAAGPKLVAADYSDRYHVSTCKIVQKIPAEHLVTFATPEEAWGADLVPCKKCNPPVPSGKKAHGPNFGSKNVSPDDTDTES